MNHKQALDYLINQLPMYQRIGPAAYKADLGNSIAIDNYLSNPHKQFKSIHIAGTNGKGSVANMLASVLHEHGYKTGLATSPHLNDYRERIRINGKKIPPRAVTRFVKEHKNYFDTIQASFFEISIALTFAYFAEEMVDIAVVETGLGGRLDSTNIITPEVSVITNIGIDHAALLGDTLEKIAKEKAGIIKPGVPVVLGRRQKEVFHVFDAASNENGSDLYIACDDLQVENKQLITLRGRRYQRFDILDVEGTRYRFDLDLLGHYQQENMLSALKTLQVLSMNTGMSVAIDAISRGLGRVMKNTGFAGRWQQLGKRPEVICDTGHNADGLSAVLKQLSSKNYKRLRVVFGLVSDKEVSTLLSMLPNDAIYYFCRPDIARGLDSRLLLAAGKEYALLGSAFNTVKEAYATALKDADSDDLIFVGGSTFVVAEVLGNHNL